MLDQARKDGRRTCPTRGLAERSRLEHPADRARLPASVTTLPLCVETAQIYGEINEEIVGKALELFRGHG
jgi:hypothetical protein